MVAHYGIGHWYGKTNMFDYFIKHKVVCISSRTKPYNKKRKGFQETFLGIKKGDDVFLKSYPRQKKALIIKAAGKVICSFAPKVCFAPKVIILHPKSKTTGEEII